MLDQWKTGQTATEYNNQLIGGRTDWGNQQIDASYQDELARRQDQQAWNQLLLENYLGLAGGSAPIAGSYLTADAQKDAAKESSNAQNTGAWLGAAGALGGGLLSGAMNSGGWGNLFKW